MITMLIVFNAYTQSETITTSARSSQNQTTTNGASNATSFEILRNSYLAQWQQLGFQSGFDAFVEDGSVQGYGVL